MKYIFNFFLYPILIMFFMTSCGDRQLSSQFDSVTQPVLGHRSVRLLELDGLKFKDLNRNGKLDMYEDWRLPSKDRSRDLISKLSLEQKAGLMLISTTRMENEQTFQRAESNVPIGSGFNEEDLVMDVNIFTRKPLPYPNMGAAGTTKAVTQFHDRHFIIRANPPIRILAEWVNNLQSLCEKDGLGIPATITSNPRNHISSATAAGLSVKSSTFSRWPSELGLAATRDLKLIREFADICRQEWLAVGIRKGYMYMADLCTEPRWQRTEGTFGDDAELTASIMSEIVLGFQGPELSQTSIALTTKHFPGGGATEGGQDPHFEWGKREVFPGGMLENNLVPFKAAIDAGTSAIMPYYSFPVGTRYEEVAYAYNREILQDLLRKELGFKGIINSDTGPIEMMPWGVEELSLTERYKKAMEAGVNIFSGSADPTKLIETLKTNPALISHVDTSVFLLLNEKFRLGLFENPYVNIDIAEKIVGKKEFQAKADLALRKSIVLLRNGDNILPLKKGTKIYFETYMQRPEGRPNSAFLPDENQWDIDFVQTPEEADLILLWILPKSKSLFASDGSPLFLSLSKNGIDTDYVKRLTSIRPSVLAINYSNPWVIDEIYNNESENIKGLMATFGTTPQAILDILTGKFSPGAKIPFSTPVSEEVVQMQKSDVPGHLEDPGYALFDFGEGLSF